MPGSGMIIFFVTLAAILAAVTMIFLLRCLCKGGSEIAHVISSQKAKKERKERQRNDTATSEDSLISNYSAASAPPEEEALQPFATSTQMMEAGLRLVVPIAGVHACTAAQNIYTTYPPSYTQAMQETAIPYSDII